MLSGTPDRLSDHKLNLTLTASANWTYQTASRNFMFTSVAPCPSDRYRHFRMQLAADNNPQWYNSSQNASALCDLSWQAGAARFPSSSAPANVSSSAWPANGAFQQLAGRWCHPEAAWQVYTWSCSWLLYQCQIHKLMACSKLLTSRQYQCHPALDGMDLGSWVSFTVCGVPDLLQAAWLLPTS